MEKVFDIIEVLLKFSPLPAILFALNEGGNLKIRDVNDLACELYGYSREEFVNLKLNDEEFFSDVIHVKKNGETFRAKVFKREIENLVIVYILDISKIKADFLSELENHENIVKERTRELEIINKELEAFAYSVSHDLKSPLRAIHGLAKIIKDEYSENLNKEAKRLFDMIIDNCNQMRNLINDLLEFSRISNIPLRKKYVDLSQMITSLFYEYTNEQERKRINFIVKETPEAYVDSNLIKHVLGNLLSNAIKFSSKKDNPVIEFGSFLKDNKVVYYLKDN